MGHSNVSMTQCHRIRAPGAGATPCLPVPTPGAVSPLLTLNTELEYTFCISSSNWRRLLRSSLTALSSWLIRSIQVRNSVLATLPPRSVTYSSMIAAPHMLTVKDAFGCDATRIMQAMKPRPRCMKAFVDQLNQLHTPRSLTILPRGALCGMPPSPSLPLSWGRTPQRRTRQAATNLHSCPYRMPGPCALVPLLAS